MRVRWSEDECTAAPEHIVAAVSRYARAASRWLGRALTLPPGEVPDDAREATTPLWLLSNGRLITSRFAFRQRSVAAVLCRRISRLAIHAFSPFKSASNFSFDFIISSQLTMLFL